MLIRGGNRLTVHTTSGLGFSDLDYLRPDLAPARLGYVYVSGVPALPDPAQPYFVSVDPGDGVIVVDVACTEVVDGFELSWNADAYVPDIANMMYNSSGKFTVPLSGTGEVYLFARTVRDGRRSLWTAYGAVPPDFDETEPIWNDDIDAYTGGPGGFVEYPGLLKVSGEYGIYVFTASSPKVVRTRGDNPDSFNVFTTASGKQLTRFGGSWKFKAQFDHLSAVDGNQNYGVIFRAREEILTAIAGETYYELAIRRKDDDEIYAYLNTGSGTTLTAEATSGNLASYFTSTSEYYELLFELNGDTFTITKVATGDVLFTATGTTIAASDERIYTGLHFKCTGADATPKITDNILIEKRIATGNPAELDPGNYYDGIAAGNLDSVFNLSQYVHWECGNTGADYLRAAYDDSTLPVLYRYNAAGTLAATDKLVTGSGTANKVAKFSAAQTVADSNITDTGALITLGSAAQVNGAVTVGVDDTGYDVTLYGATAGKKVLWDESADTLQVDASLKIPADAGAGKVLTSDADGVGTWQTMTLTHEMLSATHTDSTTGTVVRGDLITGQGATPTWTRLAAGTAGDLFNMGADEPQWSSAATLFGSGTDNYIPKFLVGATPTFADSIMSQTGTTAINLLCADAATDAATDLLVLKHDSSDTPTTNFGSSILWQLDSDTQEDRDAAELTVSWTTATDATRTSKVEIWTSFLGTMIPFLHQTGSGSQFLGYRCGNSTLSGSGQNAGYGPLVLKELTTGYYNTSFGYSGLTKCTEGFANTSFGRNLLTGLTTASGNVAVGESCLNGVTTGTTRSIAIGVNCFNTGSPLNSVAIGFYCSPSGSGASNSVAVGNWSVYGGLSAGTTVLGSWAGYTGPGAGCVLIGKEAGYYETGASKLFIDYNKRASEADGRIKALIYGIFAAANVNQYLTVNGNVIGQIESTDTNAVRTIATLRHNTTGVVANGLGTGLAFQIETSTTENTDAASISSAWVDSTHATRKANLILSVYDTAIRTGLTIAATGSGAALTADGTLTVGADDAGYDVTLYGATAGKKMLWDESADTLQLDGTLDLNGGATLGSADTDAITCTGRLIVRTVNDGDMDATDGTTAEVVFNSADSKFYGCTASGTPATWAALN